jgi:hypothetical protein
VLLAEEEEGLMSARRSLGARPRNGYRDGEDATEIEMKPLAPSIFQISSSLDTNLGAIRLKTNELSLLYKKLLITRETEKKHLEDSIDDLNYTLTKMFEACYVLIKKFEFIQKNHLRLKLDYSADELAITPPQQGTKLVLKQKQKQTANSGVKRNARGRVVEELWPLSFARSYGFQSHGSTTMDGHAILLLRWRKDEGLRVQTWESVDGVYDSKLVIQPKDINQVYADGTSRMRLTGPRGHDGNKLILDLEFADTADFLIFRDEHAVLMTSGGKCINKSDDYMAHLFKTPLPSRNEKVGTSALVGDSTASHSQ